MVSHQLTPFSHSFLRRASVLLCMAAILLTSTVSGEEVTKPLQISEFTLTDPLGAKHSLADWKNKSAVVVVFLGTECPLAKLYGPRLADLSTEYSTKNVQFVGIDSNRQDTLREIAHYASTHGIEFPMLKDTGNHVADQFGATHTPMAFVLDRERKICYRGRIDDQFGIGYSRAESTVHDLTAALDEVLAGKPVSVPVTTATGCRIGRVSQKPAKGDITYADQVSRLIQQNCVRCHRSGQVAPFSLTTYDDVTAWAETMREVMDEGRMPPWHANPKHGEFSNDASMSDADKQTFRQWMENGMPKGDLNNLPKPIPFNDDWQIGKPDVVYKMPHAYKVPAKGVVPYQYFQIETAIKDDVWVKGAEIRPNNRAVVHHAYVFFLPPGQKEPRAEDPPINAIAGFAPGMPAGLWPDGYARLIPAESTLFFQIHYTPNGSESIDQSEVGLILADPATVKKEVNFGIAVNQDFRIPAGATDFHVAAGHHLTQDTILHTLTPHMHYRGKSFQVFAHYPNGTKEVLLDVPRYDFNWQNSYLLKTPKLLPRNTMIMCDGVFDNSARNLSNPDPTKDVRWGDQTFEEMMLGSFVISLPETAVAGEFPKVTRLGENQYQVEFRYQPDIDLKNVKSVYLVGSFNEWKMTDHLMKGPDPEGWYQTTRQLPVGQHEYKFVVNGTDWKHDPNNPHQSGPFSNSVVRVRREKN